MSLPRPPIFVVEELDIGVYASVEDAQRSLEPWWVNENVGRVYDADGRLFKAQVDKVHVVLSLAEDKPSHVNEFEDLLRRYLKAIGEPVGESPGCDLQCLVNACRKICSDK